jgi:hypothetical protein
MNEERTQYSEEIIYNDDDYHEDGRVRSTEVNISSSWWKRDFSYLPIHFFKKRITEICKLLSDKKELVWGDVDDIITNFWINTFTKQMMNEYFQEYEYAYGKGLLNFQEIQLPISLGYIECIKHYITKLIYIYIHMKNKNEKLKSHILEIHEKLLIRSRYWNDHELDRIDIIIAKLK